jgi:antitoxin CptB
MTGDRETLDTLRRKLRFRAWHRGTREADLLLGAFADQHIPGFSVAELRQFECLLEESDPDISDWISGSHPVPQRHDDAVTTRLIHFELSRANLSRGI